MQQRKVLQLISSSGFFGADNVLIELSKQLRHSSFSPVIGVFDNQHNSHLEVAEVAKQHGFPVVVFPCRGRCDLRTIFLIRKFLRENEIKIIHSHGYKSNLYALAASLGKKVVRVATCHNWLGDDPKMKLYAWLDKVFLRQFNSVVAVSEAVKDELINCGFSDAKVRLIHNGIELDRLKIKGDSSLLKKQFNIEEDCRIIGTVGRLSEEKGQDYLLNAAAEILQKYPKVIFLMVGDGPERQNLEARTARITETLHTGGEATGTPFIFTGVRNDMPDIY
ncbi:MAG: glycosyltransferase, partial [Deltaproteobacteria bacterium]|nr:glycosyltransferase [Deltaproteobacteria bacterium]